MSVLDWQSQACGILLQYAVSNLKFLNEFHKNVSELQSFYLLCSLAFVFFCKEADYPHLWTLLSIFAFFSCSWVVCICFFTSLLFLKHSSINFLLLIRHYLLYVFALVSVLVFFLSLDFFLIMSNSFLSFIISFWSFLFLILSHYFSSIFYHPLSIIFTSCFEIGFFF